MLEVIFAESNKNITLLTPKSREPKINPPKNRGTALIIEKSERSFAETVKLLRTNLTQEEISNIKNI